MTQLVAPAEGHVEKLCKTSRTFKIFKKDTAKRIVYGIVYEPDVVDGQNDWATADEIEKACHRYMELYQMLSIEHGAIDKRMALVENWIQKEDTVMDGEKIKKGTWMMGVKINDDEVWKSVEDGELDGFSMEGTGERVYKPGEQIPAVA